MDKLFETSFQDSRGGTVHVWTQEGKVWVAEGLSYEPLILTVEQAMTLVDAILAARGAVLETDAARTTPQGE